MVAIPASRVMRYARRPPEQISGFLVYGSHDGVITEVISRLAEHLGASTQSETITLTDQDLANDPDRLAVELRTLPMFGGGKLIRARTGARAAAIIGDAVAEPFPQPIKLIVEVGAQKKDARLRKIFEQADHLAACPCYEPDQGGIEDLIREELAEASLNANAEVRQLLKSVLGSDYGLARAELRKLAQFAHGQDAISIDDVEAVLGDSSVFHVDNVIAAVMRGHGAAAIRQVDRLVASGYSLSAVMSNLLAYLVRTHRIKSAIESGRSADAALRQLRPPVHFRQADRIKADIRRISLVGLERMIESGAEAMARMRSSTGMDEEIATQALLDLCRERETRSTARDEP